MKIIIKENISGKDIKKYLPPCYAGLLPANIMEEQMINIIIFPYNKQYITSRFINKVGPKINNKLLQTIYFAYGFTLEAKELIGGSGGVLFASGTYGWTDESWNNVRNGK